MSKEVIALSDALDLIAQCKTDIKSSVQGKGSEIGDDLTQYAQSIDNIQFRSLQFKNNDTGNIQTSFDVCRYNDSANVSVQQYINGETSYPANTLYTVSGTSCSVTKNTPGTNKQVYRCVPTDYGTTTLTIEDTVGNVEYPIALHVPPFTIYGDYSTMSGFDSFEFIDYISVPEWVAVWDTSVQQNPNFTATFSFNDGNGHDVDAANLSFDITGDVIDAGLVTVTYVVSATSVTFTFTPYYNNDNSQYEYYNGFINIAMSDGTSLGDIAPIYLAGGDDLEPATYNINEAMINFCTVTIDPNPAAASENVIVTVTPDQGNVFDSIEAQGTDTHTNITISDLGNNRYSFTMPAEDVDLSVNCISSGGGDEPTFTYDGSDQNDPIICNVELGENEDNMDGISLNISVDGATHDVSDHTYWTPDIDNGILSNDNDFRIEFYSSLNSPGGEPRDNQWFSGTRTAGTYLKSYTITYTYSNANGEDPVMQQLDGTSITFWVQYNVTAAN